jgi:hypothetical protein
VNRLVEIRPGSCAGVSDAALGALSEKTKFFQ